MMSCGCGQPAYTSTGTTTGTDTGIYVWKQWNGETSGTVTTNASAWNNWVTVDMSSTTSTNETVWLEWNASARVVTYRPEVNVRIEGIRQRTDEEIAAEQERIRTELAQREQKRQEAIARAEALLTENLNEQQLQEWLTKKFFHVISQSGKKYRINGNSRASNVFELENEKPVRSHCVVAKDVDIPACDQYLMQKLMLEYDEQAFLNLSIKHEYSEL